MVYDDDDGDHDEHHESGHGLCSRILLYYTNIKWEVHSDGWLTDKISVTTLVNIHLKGSESVLLHYNMHLNLLCMFILL